MSIPTGPVRKEEQWCPQGDDVVLLTINPKVHHSSSFINGPVIIFTKSTEYLALHPR